MKNKYRDGFSNHILPCSHEQCYAVDGCFVWCGSAIPFEGRYYLFASVWKKEYTFRGWLNHSQIVRAVADRPEGPFRTDRILEELHSATYGCTSVHNPTIKQINGRYYLFHTATTDVPNAHSCSMPNAFEVCRYNQNICVAVADRPDGRFVPHTEPLLSPSQSGWDSTYVCNPSVFVRPDGSTVMMYKAKSALDGRLILGKAEAPTPLGVFTKRPEPLVDYHVEDPFIWEEDGMYYMIAKDMSGNVVGNQNGMLLVSQDLENWQLDENPLAFDRVIHWTDAPAEEFGHVERTQIMMENGKPVCLYNAVGDASSYSFNLARSLR